MNAPKSKKQILEEAGYKYNFDREIYFNKECKKVFSQEAIEDNDENWLSEKLAESNKNKWEFYFNESPDPRIKQQILSELDERY